MWSHGMMLWNLEISWDDLNIIPDITELEPLSHGVPQKREPLDGDETWKIFIENLLAGAINSHLQNDGPSSKWLSESHLGRMTSHIWNGKIVWIPSGKLTVYYWKWQFIVELPIKHGDLMFETTNQTMDGWFWSSASSSNIRCWESAIKICPQK